ncbi:DUF6326 family protein [Methanolobus tindarius]|uniref:DUF6326 family protein n=1 Tax=Methanolobus tindarius TaxID=2221 RepID=UPI00373AF56C
MTGTVGCMDITQQFLLNVSVLIEIPITLVLLSSMLTTGQTGLQIQKYNFRLW